MVSENLRLELVRNTLVITPTGNVESIGWDLVKDAAELLMDPLEGRVTPMVIFDLTGVEYFGSVFMALLLKCHTTVKNRGGELILAGAGKSIRELLKITALDTLWAMYETRDEALHAADSD